MQVILNKKEKATLVVFLVASLSFYAILRGGGLERWQEQQEIRQSESARVAKILGNAEREDILIYSELDRIVGWTQRYGFISHADTQQIVLWDVAATGIKRLEKENLAKLNARIVKTTDPAWTTAAIRIARHGH